MKAITLHPLFACGITFGLKTIEVRTWRTDFRGDILITSSQKKLHDTIPGHALCIAELHDVRPLLKSDAEAAWTDERHIDTNNYAWCLRNIRLIKPFPIKGKLSLWNCDITPEILIPLEKRYEYTEQEDEEFFNRYYSALFV